MKSKPPTVDRWKAIHRGAIYCAPACGCGCTYAAFLDAHTNAKALCATLDKTTAKGWKPHVWENCAWHYAATSACGRIKVHAESNPPNGKPRYYTAFLGKAGECGGTWAEHGNTPAAAVHAVIAAGKAALAGYGALITGLDELEPIALPSALTRRLGRRQLSLSA